MRAQRRSRGDLEDLRRLGPNALEIWDESSPAVLARLPAIADIVAVSVQQTGDRPPRLVFVLHDIDGISCTFWCNWDGKEVQGDGGYARTFDVSAVSPY